MRHLVACTIALLAAAVPAQEPGWQVPTRGALVYQRSTERFTVTAPATRLNLDNAVVGGSEGGHEWRYFACPKDREPAGWQTLDFDDSGWLSGRSGFGTELGQRPEQHTRWGSDILLLRTTVDLGRTKPKALLLRIDHDDTVKVFAGGTQIVDDPAYGIGKVYVVAGDALKGGTGPTTFAVRCENTGGAQRLDVAISVLPKFAGGVRTLDGLRETVDSAQDLARRARSDLFGGFQVPGLVLHGELDAALQRSRVPPSDLREVAFWVACDLRRQGAGGSYTEEVPRMYRLGDLQLRGRIEAADGDGWQDIDLAVDTAPELDARGDSKRFLAAFVRPFVLYGFSGRLHVRRHLVASAAGLRVAECRCTLTGRLLHGKNWKDHVADLEQIESYRFESVRDNQDAEFRAMVHRAIERGTGFLQKELANLDAAGLKPGHEGEGTGIRSYRSGRLALALLALVRGGVPLDDAVVQASRRELCQRELLDTYSLGNALMALEACYAPPTEIADILQGRIDRSTRREAAADDRATMQRWSDRLLQNVDTRVDPAYVLRFNYVRDGRFDHSVNQYGLLGLYSAHLCGIEVSPTQWEAALNHLLAAQCEAGPPMQLSCTDYGDLLRLQAAAAGGVPAATLASPMTVGPAGWNYQEPKRDGENAPSWGSMTCAGITGVSICQAALRDCGLKRDKLQRDASAARNAGFGWLAQNLTVRYHPGILNRQQQWYYYYLYSLERAALLSGVAWIQGRDWYFEGAMMLVLMQNADGSWPAELHPDQAIERAAMAVLFLTKSTPPVLTGR